MGYEQWLRWKPCDSSGQYGRTTRYEWGDLQRADSQDQNYRRLFLAAHLQIPNQEHGKDRESPVTSTGDSRVSVENSNDDVGAHASALTTRVLSPEVCGRKALEKENKEEEQAVELSDAKNGPDDSLVDFVDA